jgi:aspartate carbamoyltransferase regulatory subunit
MLQTAREIVPASTKTRKLVSYAQEVDSGKREKKDFLKLKDRSGNIYENKGSAFHSPGQSGNVIENTGSYALKAAMLCAPQRRGSPVGGSPTQIVVGKSDS